MGVPRCPELGVRGGDSSLNPLRPESDPGRRGGARDPPAPLPDPAGGKGAWGGEGGRGVGLTPHPPLPPPPAFSFLLLNVKCKNNFYIFYFFLSYSRKSNRGFNLRYVSYSPFHFHFRSVLVLFGVREKKRLFYYF